MTLFFTSFFFFKKRKVNIKNIQQSSIKFMDGLSVSLFDFFKFFPTTIELDYSCCRFHPQRFSLQKEFEKTAKKKCADVLIIQTLEMYNKNHGN